MSATPGPKMSNPTPDEVLQFVQQKQRPFVETKEVSEHFDNLDRRTIFNRLDMLADQNQLVKHMVTDSCAVWYTPDQLSRSRDEPLSESQ